MRATRPIRAGLALALLVASIVPSASRAARPRVVALERATVVVAPGKVIEGGTVVLRDGLIVAAAAGAPIPSDAEVVDAKGLWIYPALIDALASPGTGAEPERATRGTGPGGGEAARGRGAVEPGDLHPLSRVRPERRAIEAFLPFEGERKREAETWRNLGFAVVSVTPSTGIFRGTSAAVALLDERPVAEIVLRDGIAQHVGFDRGEFGEGYPTSLMGTVAAIRQTLLDAGRHRVWSARYERNPSGIPRPDRRAAWEALVPVLERRMQVVFEASDPQDVLLADRLAREFDLDAIVAGSGHEAEIAEAIAATGRTLIQPVSFPDRPKIDDPDAALDVTTRELRRFADAPAGPGRLAKAGVRFALTARGLKNPAEFRAQVRKIVEAGLPEQTALAALTTVPARLMGIERLVGTLEPGKIANVVVADGPLFGKDTKIRRIYVDGVEHRAEPKPKPKGDPDAVVDPRGTWSVVFEFGSQSTTRTWTLTGSRGGYRGTAETRGGTVAFERIELAGNVLTVVFPPSEGRGANEVSVVIRGDTFEGSFEAGPRSIPIRGTRTGDPEGGR